MTAWATITRETGGKFSLSILNYLEKPGTDITRVVARNRTNSKGRKDGSDGWFRIDMAFSFRLGRCIRYQSLLHQEVQEVAEPDQKIIKLFNYNRLINIT